MEITKIISIDFFSHICAVAELIVLRYKINIKDKKYAHYSNEDFERSEVRLMFDLNLTK